MDTNDYRLAEEALEALKRGNFSSALEKLTEFVETHPTRSKDDLLRDASNTLERDYMDDVHGIADSLAQEWRSGAFDGNRDAFYEAIDQAVDGTSRVTYTGQAQECLRYSRNDDAMLTELGAIEDQGGCMPWSQMAYFAMRRDVIDRLEHMGIDLNGDPPEEGARECSDCGEWKKCSGGEDDNVCDDCHSDNGDVQCDTCEKWFDADVLEEGECAECRAKTKK